MYRILLPNNEEVVMNREMWSHFKTLHDMTMDCQVEYTTKNECLVSLSVFPSGVTISVPILERMIDFYDAKKETSLLDEQAIVELIMAANYLEAGEFLLFITDELYTRVRQESTLSLETRVASSVKRKLVEEPNVANRVRIQYRREQLVRLVMRSLLPLPELVRGIDKRIRKYVDPIACISSNPYNPSPLVVIQYDDDAVLISDSEWHVEDAISEDKKALYSERLSEVVGTSNGHYAVLNRDEQLSVFGNTTLKKKPIGNTRVIAIWSGTNNMLFMTHNNTLYVYQFGTEVLDTIQGLEGESPILDVSIGTNHALILTRDGLYGVYLNDSWQRSQLNFGVRGDWTRNRARKLDVRGATIRTILARGDYSITVTTSGLVYATGPNYASVPLDIQVSSGVWQQSLVLSLMDVRLLTGDESRTIVHSGTDNELYLFGNYLRRDDSGKLLKLASIEGEVRSITSVEEKYFIVVTTRGLFIYNATPDQVNALGGTDTVMKTFPFKLSLPFVATKSNKKLRLDCHLCCAEATMLDTKYSRLFCSRYCFIYTQHRLDEEETVYNDVVKQ